MKVIYLKQYRTVKAVRARESEICEREDSLRVALNIYRCPWGHLQIWGTG